MLSRTAPFLFLISAVIFNHSGISKANSSIDILSKNFHDAVKNKYCPEVVSTLEELSKKESIYFGTLGKFYEKGFCFPKDFGEAYKAYEMLPLEISELGYYKRALMYFNGIGVQKDEVKALYLFNRSSRAHAIRVVDFSILRFDLQLMLDDAKLPEVFEKKIQYLEDLEKKPNAKFKFVQNLRNQNQLEKIQESGLNLLISLVEKHNHPQAAFEVGEIFKSAKDYSNAYAYFFKSALKGHSYAQAEIGRAYFFENIKEASSKVVAYEMLLRANQAGLVNSIELKKASKTLSDFQLQTAIEEAAKPLPH